MVEAKKTEAKENNGNGFMRVLGGALILASLLGVAWKINQTSTDIMYKDINQVQDKVEDMQDSINSDLKENDNSNRYSHEKFLEDIAALKERVNALEREVYKNTRYRENTKD